MFSILNAVWVILLYVGTGMTITLIKVIIDMEALNHRAFSHNDKNEFRAIQETFIIQLFFPPHLFFY